MPLSALPALLASSFVRLAGCLQKRSAEHLPALLLGILLARPPHRHLLVPRLWHHRRVPQSLQHRLGRRPQHRPDGCCPAGRHRAVPGQGLLASGRRRHPTRRWGPHIEAADLIFRDKPLRQEKTRRVGLTLVCPTENGSDTYTDCGVCKFCWK
jgi:hypothetical protein